ncbi:MAG: hypothetical protein M1814_003185 [Vezdaea aestivalis]|nr:MAG: hypothetical protein M1814_003185 [Vezdaea aestivalis]
MLCAISGECPEVPVASRKTGHVFERRLIEKYIAENGKDPVAGGELSLDDLIDLKTPRIVRPRPPTLTSIPSLLSVFQNEWDALALETFTIRQQLVQTRQELSAALYQHDAAVRVISKLTKERDDARDALSKVSVTGAGAASNGDNMQIDLPEHIVRKVVETNERLSKTRRKRAVPPNWASGESIQQYKPTTSTEPMYPGCHTLAVDESGELALFGGSDGVAGVYSFAEKKLLGALKGDGGAVTDTAWFGEHAIISTAKGSLKIFKEGKETSSLKAHSGPITGLAMHPSGEILASVGEDKSYVFYDLVSPSVVSQVYSNEELTTAAFHPDGHLFAAGSRNGQIKLFEVESSTNAANFDTEGSVTSLSFSENGTWLASASSGQTTVIVWDLRKLAQLKVLEIGGAIETLGWDYTGQFLACGGPSGITVQQYTKATKEWSEPLRSSVATSAIVWGKQAQSLLSASLDGALSVISGDS